MAKRRDALATASPYTVATIGFCDDYLYCKGILCYSLDNEVRILDLHHSSNEEVVVSILGLLTRAVPEIHANLKGTFKILYYSDHIISCLYQSSGPDLPAWLIVFGLEDEAILIAPETLNSVEKLFVRHNKDFLYYGTYSDTNADGDQRWVIRGYDFENRKWFDEKIRLSEMAGSDIGVSVCFEIHEDYFYAVSSEAPFETEEIDPSSFYHGFRFPLNSPCKDLLEKTQDEDMWRRQLQEGPLDERWMSMQLDVDEVSGKLKIVEARKEWYQGSSKSGRNYYTTDIIFPKDQDEFEDDDESLHLLYNLEAPPRNPYDTHLGDDGTSGPPYTLSKTYVRAYQKSSNTYLDLVDDPLPTDWNSIQRLRLLAGSRKLGPPLVNESGLLCEPSGDLYTSIKQLYRDGEVSLWPRTPAPGTDTELDLYTLLNPPKFLGNVQGTWDERSLVYVTGDKGAPQALIFVGFDAALRLKGLRQWEQVKDVGSHTFAHSPKIIDSTVELPIAEKRFRDTAGCNKGNDWSLMRKVPAMYLELTNLGYYFGKPRL